MELKELTASPSPEGVAKRLRQAAYPHGASEVARRTKTSRETTRRYLAHGRAGVRFIAEFCRVYNVNPTWLILGVGQQSWNTQSDNGLGTHPTTELARELHTRLTPRQTVNSG